MQSNSFGGHFFLGLFIALGLTAGGYFVGQTLYNAKVALNTAEAKGLAERRVTADVANWEIAFTVSGKTRDDIPALHTRAERHRQTIIAVLKENGLEEGEIEAGVLDYRYKEYRDEDKKLVDQVHKLVGTIGVETQKVQQINKVRAAVSKLIAKGIDIQNRPPVYRFTRLNEIKPEMLREATKNARIAANEFAENAGVKVGGIRSARQGGFYIRDAGEEHGDSRKIEKDVRVVTTITFYLTE